MSIYATEGELLPRVVAGLVEGVVLKTPIIAVVMEDFYAVLSSKGLEGAFSGDGFFGGIVNLAVHEAEATEVVDKNGGAPVALFGEFTFSLCEESKFS